MEACSRLDCAFATWLAVCGLMLLYGYARQIWPNEAWPGLLPPFHWLFHLRLAAAFLAGYGLYCGVAAITSFFARWRQLPVSVVLLITLAILLLFQHRRFARRYDFVEARNVALQYAASPGFTDTVAWLRRETPTDAVILASPLDGLILLGAAGRKTVVIVQEFSNPYVPFEPRAMSAAEMFDSLADHDRDRFLENAAKYHVSYVLLSSASRGFVDRCLTAPFVTNVSLRGYYAVLRIEQP